MKNFFRKIIVVLKRKPQLICLISLMIAFVFYSFNLTAISNTTAKLQKSGMGLCGFCTMLFSILSIITCKNAFPTRKKANIPMMVLLYVLVGIVVFADIKYRNTIYDALMVEQSVTLSDSTMYIVDSYNLLKTHIILLCISVALIAAKPVYAKLLRKIKTSIAVEDSGDMEAIELEN